MWSKIWLLVLLSVVLVSCAHLPELVMPVYEEPHPDPSKSHSPLSEILYWAVSCALGAGALAIKRKEILTKNILNSTIKGAENYSKYEAHNPDPHGELLNKKLKEAYIESGVYDKIGKLIKNRSI